MSRAGTAQERAARLLRWYPPAWRDRYGDEFTELLIADIQERPRSAVRALDVARGGVMARLADAGLTGFAVPVTGITDPYRQVRASLGSAVCMLALCLAFGAAMWSQLMIGWQWSASAAPPPGAPVPAAIPAPAPAAIPAPAAFAAILTSAAMLALLALGILAALPVLVAVSRRFTRRLAAPAAVVLVAGAIAFAGGRHFGNGWPGTGGHGGFVPAGLEAFAWAASLSVSAYWAHPAALGAFPAAELTWMMTSPLVLAAFVLAVVTLLRRARLTPRLLGYEARLAGAACAMMAVFLAGASWWVATGGQRSLFHAGLIDVAAVAVLAASLAVAVQATRTAGRGLRLARS